MVTREERYRRVATETLGYLLREMRHPDGGFFSSQDADSEGVEGKFFTWSWDELVELVGADAAAAFGATPEGNWAGEAGERRTSCGSRRAGLRRRGPRGGPTDPVRGAGGTRAPRDGRQGARRLERDGDPGVRRGGAAFGDAAFLEAAVTAAAFVLSNLRGAGRPAPALVAGGVPGGPAYADDHALLASATLTLFSTDRGPPLVPRGEALADDLVRLFADRSVAGSSRRGSTSTPSWSGRRSSTTTPSPRGTRSPPTCSSGRAPDRRPGPRADRGLGAPADPRRARASTRPASGTRCRRSTSTSDRPRRWRSSGRRTTRHEGARRRGRRRSASSRTRSSPSARPTIARRPRRWRSCATVRWSTGCPPPTSASDSRAASRSRRPDELAAQLLEPAR